VNSGFLLDTNIPSELMRQRPEPKVNDWVAAQDISVLFLSVVSIGKLETGFTTMQDAARRARLEAALERSAFTRMSRSFVARCCAWMATA
jgi:toxin FitB